jgi:uncharacterized protein (DUF433 family)
MKYIEINSNIMVGKPVVKGTRVTVENIISMLSQGISIEEIMVEYKGIKKVEILACLQYAEGILEKTSTFDLDKLAS